MYRIMIVKSKRDNYESLYQYLTTTTEDDETEILEIETKDDLDVKVESMLNDEGYAKSDFIIVNVIDYTIDATDYSDESTDSEDTETTESTDESENTDATEEDSYEDAADDEEASGEDVTEETE